MIDRELVEEVEALSRSTAGVTMSSAEATAAVVDRVAARFSVDRFRLWWREGLQGARVVECEPADELTVLQRMLPQDEVLALVVTDDEPPPWIAVSGPWRALSEMLKEARLFEFFVVPDGLDWIVFSTHDNRLVVVGNLPLR